jgi:hypothetical protein
MLQRVVKCYTKLTLDVGFDSANMIGLSLYELIASMICKRQVANTMTITIHDSAHYQ